MPLSSPSVWWGTLTNDQKKTVLDNVGKEASALYQRYMDTIEESVGLDYLTGEELIETFRKRSPEVWARLQAQFPADYDEQMVQWQKLEMKLLKNPPQPRKYVAQSPDAQVGLALPRSY